MRSSVRLFAALLLVLALFMASDIGVAEARTCKSQSQRFKGPCARDSNCATVCLTEGFHGGDCSGFRRRCFCTRQC